MIDHAIVADTIRGQIPNICLYSLGARDFVYAPEGKGNTQLMFRVGKSDVLEKVIITYKTGVDLYDVRFVRFNPGVYETLYDKTTKDVYCDNLADVILDMVHNA